MISYNEKKQCDEVLVESSEPLKGFAKYLRFDSHPSVGPDLYRYQIPRELLEKARRLGGELIEEKERQE